MADASVGDAAQEVSEGPNGPLAVHPWVKLHEGIDDEDESPGARPGGPLKPSEEPAEPPPADIQRVEGLCAPAVDEDGVCCHAGSSCNAISRGDCLGGGGSWLAGETCPSAKCRVDQLGACCLPDCSCDSLSKTDFGYGNPFTECASIGGHYLGAGTSCSTLPCGTIPVGP